MKDVIDVILDGVVHDVVGCAVHDVVEITRVLNLHFAIVKIKTAAA